MKARVKGKGGMGVTSTMILPTFGLNQGTQRLEAKRKESEKKLQQTFITPKTILKALALEQAATTVTKQNET